MRNLLFYILLAFVLAGCADSHCIEGDCVEGYGILQHKDGWREEGNWQGGKLNGYGKQLLGEGIFEGDIYEGYFENGKYNGKGTYYFCKYDAKLIVNYQNGKPHGNGTVVYGKNSKWTGVYKGIWNHGKNEDFQEFIRTSSNGKTVLYDPFVFIDTIHYYYQYAKINHVVRLMDKITEKDLTQFKPKPEQLEEIIDSLIILKNDLEFSISMLNSFEEYDSVLQYRKMTVSYLNVFQDFFNSEFGNWLLYVQHKPNDDKPMDIYRTLKPPVDSMNAYGKRFKRMQDEFLDEYE